MLCRVVPPIVARHPEILNFPKPKSCTKNGRLEYIKIQKRINNLLEYKLELKCLEKEIV